MESRWNDHEAKAYLSDPLQLRVYTSRLLGQESALVSHGGGNTSVKTVAQNVFGETEKVLYVKGSGWDLATIEAKGFAPVKLDLLLRMAELETLTDFEMVNAQRTAMTNPYAPNPSVEAILHAIIPFQYVDHTHADTVLTLTNTEDGEERIREIYGDQIMIVPYVMPGFLLAKKIYEMTHGVDWTKIKGMVLMNHGLFTFHNDARESYEQMIYMVSQAEAYFFKQGVWDVVTKGDAHEDLITLARLRKEVSQVRGQSVLAKLDNSPEACGFTNLSEMKDIATRGPITPNHTIRTKPFPLILEGDFIDAIQQYAFAYQNYFQRYDDGSLTCVDLAPRWAIWPKHGTIAFGENIQETSIISKIANNTVIAIQRGEALGGWKPLTEKEIFEVEYWELEQAKLGGNKQLPFEGKSVLISGAASGIGKACAEMLHAQGAAIVALDINPAIKEIFNQPDQIGIACDLTNQAEMEAAVKSVIQHFGGLDILVSNAGIFPKGQKIEEIDAEIWNRCIEINLTSHQRLLQACTPYLKLGIDPSIVIIASKNVPAPGPGAAAYSVSKAGLTQLARVAALELGGDGIRVNMLHPHAVFDTAIWTDEVLTNRAKHYGMSVEEYKKNNLLKVEISSKDVAALTCAMAGDIFSKTTGAQVTIDGGSDRTV
ncbi:MAG: bifunctional aldolase/short-chain dehydrogenase [SAR324 cluster bacterium]|nr:bifunctional aldolase/short-chain dehydrogenase [SAR324 cluster bacterium]